MIRTGEQLVIGTWTQNPGKTLKFLLPKLEQNPRNGTQTQLESDYWYLYLTFAT